jgi:hypothetical protein
MLLDNRISMPRYVLRAGLISFLPSMAIVAILAAIGIMDEQSSPTFEGSAIFLLMMIVLIGPPIETLFMAPILWALSRITKSQIPLAAMSALVWAALHSLLAPAWGLGVIWPFFVFSCAYLTWRKRSFWRAILVTSCVHSFQNLLPGIAAVAMQ